jgi:hypothetical protein
VSAIFLIKINKGEIRTANPPLSAKAKGFDLIASNQAIPEAGSKGSIFGCRLPYWGVNFRLAKLHLRYENDIPMINK